MAGDVAAFMGGATLHLYGDSAANDLTVTSGSAPGEVVVHGHGTTVNGSRKAQSFFDVQHIEAHLAAGDDRLDVHHVNGLWQLVLNGGEGNDSISVRQTNLGTPGSFTSTRIDGGLGDDDLSLIGATFDAAYASVAILGDENLGVIGQTGNDTISVTDTLINASGAYGYSQGGLSVYGDINRNSAVTGGNDVISVTNTTIALQPGDYFEYTDTFLTVIGDANENSLLVGGNDDIQVTNTQVRILGGGQYWWSNDNAYVSVVGDSNLAAYYTPGAPISRIIGGNDSIRITNSEIYVAAGSYYGGVGYAYLYAIGDSNYAAGYSGAPAPATSTIDGGNDTIVISNSASTFARGATFYDAAYTALVVLGDNNTAYGESSATINGGNDVISVDRTIVNAEANSWSAASVLIYGDANYADMWNNLGAVATINGGNDTINVTNSRIRSEAAYDSTALLSIWSDYDQGPNAHTFGGADTVQVQNVRVEGSGPSIDIKTGGGNDELKVLNSAFDYLLADLGEGDDELLFNGNDIGIDALLYGGLGSDDRLQAHGNSGTLAHSAFEVVNAS